MDKNDHSIKSMIIVTIIVGILVFGGVFYFTFSNLDIDNVEIEKEISTSDIAQKTMTASLLNIDFDKEEVKLYDFNKNVVYQDTFQITKATRYLDKDGKLLTSHSFSNGLIVDIVYNDSNNVISKMQLNKKAWETTNVTNYNFDYITKVMEINGVSYTLDPEVVINYNGNKVNYEELQDKTLLLSVRGYDRTVLAIGIEEYLGRIKLNYPESLKESTVQIGYDKIVNIEDLEKTYLRSGDYNIVITKKGINDIELKAHVDEDTLTELNVDDVELKITTLLIKSNVESFMVSIKSNDGYINRMYTDDPLIYTNCDSFSDGKIELPYGIYALTFTKNGYQSVTKKIELSQELKTLNVNFNIKNELGETVNTEDTIKLSIETTPSGGKIYVNGTYIGETKITTRVPKGEVNIKVEKDGYQPIERNYTLDSDKEYSFVLTNDNIYESPTGEIVENDGDI